MRCKICSFHFLDFGPFSPVGADAAGDVVCACRDAQCNAVANLAAVDTKSQIPSYNILSVITHERTFLKNTVGYDECVNPFKYQTLIESE